MSILPNLKKARRWILLTALIVTIFFAISSPAEEYSSFQFSPQNTNLKSVSASPLLRTCSWVCVERVPPGCKRRNNPWDVCACVRQEYVCTGPPDPTISATLTCSAWGVNGWCIGDESLDLVATEPDGENVLISGDLNGDVFSCGPEAGSVNCSIPLPEGTGTVNYLATSAQGTTAGGSKSWQRDATLPVIDGSLTGTNGDNGWFISPAEVTASVTESGSGLSAFETSLDNTNWTAYTAPISYNDGVYLLKIRAIDVAGNIATVDLPISVDTVAPTIDGALSGTMGSANWYISAVQASSTASDVTSGIGTFESSSNGGAWTAYTAPIIFEDGKHSVIFKVVDVAGNSSETALYSFKVDTSAPHINLPSRWYIWESITFRAEEKTSGFTDIEMQIMDSQGRWKKIEKHWSTDQDSFAHTILWDRAFADGILAPIGNYPVMVRAWDEAGNMSEKTGQIIIPQPDAAPLPTFTPTPVQEIVAVETEESTERQEVVAIIEEEALPVEEEKEEEEKKESIFTFGSKSETPTPSNSPSSSPSSAVVWGATASAAIGAFAAQIAERKRREAEEEAARKRAEREYQKRVWAAGARRYNQAKRVKVQAAKSSWIAQQTSQWLAEYNKKPEEDPYAGIAEWHERQDKANAAVISEYKAIREKKRKETMREKVLGFKEKLLNPTIPPVAASVAAQKPPWWKKAGDFISEHADNGISAYQAWQGGLAVGDVRFKFFKETGRVSVSAPAQAANRNSRAYFEGIDDIRLTPGGNRHASTIARTVSEGLVRGAISKSSIGFAGLTSIGTNLWDYGKNATSLEDFSDKTFENQEFATSTAVDFSLSMIVGVGSALIIGGLGTAALALGATVAAPLVLTVAATASVGIIAGSLLEKHGITQALKTNINMIVDIVQEGKGKTLFTEITNTLKTTTNMLADIAKAKFGNK
ncbi:MAG: hypothetical protein GY755_08355 [Chloroflexi bacterium]|nr:hypothetical protein [Chloroflexota bacterium]